MTNRRSFLKSCVAIPTGLVAAKSFAKEFDPSLKFDKEADVVIVGLGGAGAAAALAAKDGGADVLILEKLPQGGGNTAAAGGGFIIPANADDAYTYLAKTYEYADSDMDKDLVKTFCNEAVKTKDYFKSLDPSIELRVMGHANFPKLPCSDTITKYAVKGPKTGGLNLYKTLLGQIEKRQIPILYSTPAVQLIKRGDEVVGVVANQGGKDLNIKARKAVILTTGGYEYDPEMLQNFCQGTNIRGLGSPGNTGDGIRLAQSAGAKLWHMTSYSCPLGMEVPGLKSMVLLNSMIPGYIWVDQDGRRFNNESDIDFHSCLYGVNKFDAVNHRYPAIPCYMVFDETARKSGPITHTKFGYASVIEGYKWSPDCSKEIEAGIVKKADSIGELAKLIGVPPQELEATVARWNENVKKGSDPDFHRRMEKPKSEKDSLQGITARKLSAPIETGPFYAVVLYPSLLNTQGGPRRNQDAQLINALGKPIPRLYGAGELGSIWGTIYQGSSNIAECLVFGRIAGRSTAKLDNWS